MGRISNRKITNKQMGMRYHTNKKNLLGFLIQYFAFYLLQIYT